MHATVILGCGGHAKVIIEVLRQVGLYEPIGCVGPATAGPARVLDVPILGDDECLPRLRSSGVRCAFVALGDNRLRRRLLQHLRSLGFQLASAISSAATISPSARLGEGLAILPGAIVGPDSTLADGVIINSRASVDHDGRLGECCHIGPGVTLAGCVSVGEEAFVATGASVIPQVEIGAGSLIGAGAVVVRDIPANMLAYGCPARCQRSLSPAPALYDRQLCEPRVGESALRLVI